MADSILDKFTKVRAQTIRTFSDLNVDYLGSSVQILRIAFGEEDILGERTEQIDSTILNDVIIKFPWNSNIRLFQDVTSQNEADTNSIDIWEVLPIEMKVKFVGNFDTEPIVLKQGDIVVTVLRDENDNKIPLTMQITRIIGGFDTKYIYEKKYELTLYRGNLPSAINNTINNYVDGLT